MKITEAHVKQIDDMIYTPSKQIIEADEEHPAFLFLLHCDEQQIRKADLVLVSELMTGESGKDQLAAIMDVAVGIFDMIVLVSEAWVSTYDSLPPPADRPMPRDDPNRTEVLYINIRSRDDQVMVTHPISRNPTKLEPAVLPTKDVVGRFTNRR